MRYSQGLQLYKSNDRPKPNPFYIFLSGGGGVEKSFLTKLITEYMKKTLKTSRQNMDKYPVVVVSTSTGKGAINVNGTTLHSAFGLPVGDGSTFTQLAWDKKDNFLKKIFESKSSTCLRDVNYFKTFNDLSVNM